MADRVEEIDSRGGGERLVLSIQKDSILPTDRLGKKGGDAMNAPPKLRGRSSRVPLVKRLEDKKRPSPRNPLEELNRASAKAPRGGCFRFLLPDSSAKESLAGSNTVLQTPRSAPPNQGIVANPFRRRTFQKKASKSDVEAPKQLRSRKPSKPRASDLIQRWNKRKPISGDKDSVPKIYLDGQPVGSCLVSSPERTHLGFEAYAGTKAAREGEQKLTSTPTSAATPTVEASISPEVPAEASASAAAAAPVCFATGHLIVGVHDRRKCRPRGILTIGESDLEKKVHHGDTDRTPVSTTPPLAGASIRWLFSPSRNANPGPDSNTGSSSHWPAEPSLDWQLPPCEYGEDAHKGEFLMEIRTTPDHEIWNFSPCNSSEVKSPQFRGLLSLNSPGSETTPSSGIGIQRTPTTAGSVSPFSLIMQKIAKTSKNKLVRDQQGRGNRYGSAASENSPFSDNFFVEGLGTPSSHSSSTKKHNVGEFKRDSIAEALESISLSPNARRNDANCQATYPGLSFQFGCLATASNSVELNHFQNPSCDRIPMLDDVSVQEKVLPSSETRISWREGLVSRIFEMEELDCWQWLSDDEGNTNHHEEENLGSVSDLKCDKESSCPTLNSENVLISKVGFGSVELVLEAEKDEAKVPTQRPISCAESMSMEGLVMDSSNDSDWMLFYKNHLFEV